MKPTILLLLLTISAHAQSFVHWAPNTHVKVYLMHFSDKEKSRVQAAIDSWIFPSGITMKIEGETDYIRACQDCLTVNREDARSGEWGDIRAEHLITSRLITFAVISLDRRAGSGQALQRVMAHELGHSLGCDHSEIAGSVMAQKWHTKDSPYPTVLDVENVRRMYAGGNNAEVRTSDTGSVSDPDLNVRMGISGRMASGIWSSERETLDALKGYAFKRTVTIETLDHAGRVNGAYRRNGHMVLGDDGRRVEIHIENPRPTLKGLKITKVDLDDFGTGQMLGLNPDHPELYRFYGEGNELSVRADMTKGVRVFQGNVTLVDGRIVKLVGRTWPEGNERFPLFTLERKLVDGHWFPSRLEANDTLYFEKSSVRVRWVIEFTEYKRFGATSTITEVKEESER